MATISVRNLVEFILREGNIDSGEIYGKDVAAMQEGTKIHKMLQKKGGPCYVAEVPLDITKEVDYKGYPVTIKIEGRADGIIENEEEVTIHEIKSMYRDVRKYDFPENLHLAQAKCYAAMYYLKEEYDENIRVKITYCQIETMITKDFEEEYTKEDILTWFDNLLFEYAKWIVWQENWIEKRNKHIKKMNFPFEYREGQYDLVKGVYFSLIQNKKLFLQAPTGVGKTISTVFPAVTGLGHDLVDKIFYLTAKTITRTVAEEAFSLLVSNGVPLKVVTLTAKEKICILDKPECNPGKCERAKGHYDRINDAIYDMLTNEKKIDSALILEYSEKHMVCPFEMSLDITLWADAVIMDYNYAFDPKVYLKRFFAEGGTEKYIFLVDEAHNLVDRARNMYTASINKSLVMKVKKAIKAYDEKLFKSLERLNKIMLDYKRVCDEFSVLEDVSGLGFQIMRCLTFYDDFMKDVLPVIQGKVDSEDIKQLYFDMRFFVSIYDIIDEKYKIYADYNENSEFRITLSCMDASNNLKERLKKARSTVFFSATLLPIRYYIEQLGGNEEDYTMYAKSSFKNEQQLIMIANDVSTKYTRRNKAEYCKIAEYIVKFVNIKTGNYMVFFPSYKMLSDVFECICGMENEFCDEIQYIIQKKNMNENDRESFLDSFKDVNGTKVGLCVLGGIFGEGIDLKEDMLIGAVIVGTGLPMVGNERQMYRDYYDDINGKGFEYAYLYPGMNKVLQAAGRVIRTASDRGIIMLLDDRFCLDSYSSLFPREWSNCRYVNLNTVEKTGKEFWAKSSE